MNDYTLTQHQIDKMDEYGVPAHMRGALVRYYNNRLPPGGFLTAVLSNDLMGALSQADETNKHALPAYGMWLYNQAPIGSYGSRENVRRWLEGEQEAA